MQLDRVSGCRLSVTNENVPRILGSVLAILADENINVIDMLNKSSELNEQLKAKLASAERERNRCRDTLKQVEFGFEPGPAFVALFRRRPVGRRGTADRGGYPDIVENQAVFAAGRLGLVGEARAVQGRRAAARNHAIPRPRRRCSL